MFFPSSSRTRVYAVNNTSRRDILDSSPFECRAGVLDSRRSFNRFKTIDRLLNSSASFADVNRSPKRVCAAVMSYFRRKIRPYKWGFEGNDKREFKSRFVKSKGTRAAGGPRKGSEPRKY